jgi:hypothetical protein
MPWTYDDTLGWVNQNIVQPVGAAADKLYGGGLSREDWLNPSSTNKTIYGQGLSTRPITTRSPSTETDPMDLFGAAGAGVEATESPSRDPLSTSAPMIQKENYSGYHLSTEKIPHDGQGNVMLYGDYRGAIPHGQEAARLDAYPKAPSGIYAYDNGTRADASIVGSHKNRYEINGQFSLADLSHPEVQKLRQYAIDSAQGDQRAGLNAFEHSLKAGGFDGYRDSSNPGTTFLFGNVPATDPLESQRAILKENSKAAKQLLPTSDVGGLK